MKFIRSVAATIVGSLLYIGLNWVPIIGPLIVGFLANWIRRGDVKEGFNVGVLSGTLGFIGLIALLSNFVTFSSYGINAIVTVLVLWIVFLWNLMGILLCGVGGALSPLIFSVGTLFEKQPAMTKKDAKTFLICPNCGVGNLETEKVCGSCGINLSYEL